MPRREVPKPPRDRPSASGSSRCSDVSSFEVRLQPSGGHRCWSRPGTSCPARRGPTVPGAEAVPRRRAWITGRVSGWPSTIVPAPLAPHATSPHSDDATGSRLLSGASSAAPPSPVAGASRSVARAPPTAHLSASKPFFRKLAERRRHQMDLRPNRPNPEPIFALNTSRRYFRNLRAHTTLVIFCYKQRPYSSKFHDTNCNKTPNDC